MAKQRARPENNSADNHDPLSVDGMPGVPAHSAANEGIRGAPVPAGMGHLVNEGKPRPTHQQADADGDTNPTHMERVLIELQVPRLRSMSLAQLINDELQLPGFTQDPAFAPVPSTPPRRFAASFDNTNDEVVLLAGTVATTERDQLEAHPNVLRVLRDTKLEPFVVKDSALQRRPDPPTRSTTRRFDCSPGAAKGSLADVARYLRVDALWHAGFQGEQIVVGVVDGGITAYGRTIRRGERARVKQVIDGFPKDWGTTAAAWDEHGNMVATDVLGIAPKVQLYDLRISDGGFVSTVIAAYQWAIDHFHRDGTPHILTNSYGIYQEAWDPDYANDPDHPLTRKIVEAIDAGILVLFAAGNCGDGCPTPDRRCGSDTGSGRSIWGANGHPDVITVGAATIRDQIAGYSSQGPAALDDNKPDVCAPTHFKGYFPSDTGTSAATPIAAGVVALLKQAVPDLTQMQVKQALRETSRDLGGPGWDVVSGAGMIQAKAAFDLLQTLQQPRWEQLDSLVVEAPCVVPTSNEGINLFLVQHDRELFQLQYDGNSWQEPVRIGGFCVEAPAAASASPEQLEVFVVGRDRALYHAYRDSGVWTTFEHVGGFCVTTPAAVAFDTTRSDCFVVGLDRAIYHTWGGPNNWHDFERIDGASMFAPAVALADDTLTLLMVGWDHALYECQWDGSTWSSWQRLDGYCLSAPALLAHEADQIEVYVVGPDHSLYQRNRTRGKWGEWRKHGGLCFSTPAVVATGTHARQCFVTAYNQRPSYATISSTITGSALTREASALADAGITV
ncbi:MAG: S8 family serine peptidase [Chloroflexota bacterium]|nr:S8 family serine peptidase [Chloroflexota bacterium]